MKHVKLFESFFTGYSAVGVFLETQMSVGVFPTEEAEEIYTALNLKKKPEFDSVSSIHILELPEDHDLVGVSLGATELYTTTEEDIIGAGGEATHDIVELGRNYEMGEEAMLFKAYRDLNGFVLLDSAGGTRFLSKKQMLEHI
jgi:hypothetical protein